MDVKQEILAIDTGQILRPRDWPARVPAWLHRPRAVSGAWGSGPRASEDSSMTQFN